MSDTVTIVWTDATGTYTNAFTIESPSLDDVRKASTPMMTPVPETSTETPEEFYARLSLQMVNQVMYQAQSHRQQQAMAMVPSVVITPVEITKDE